MIIAVVTGIFALGVACGIASAALVSVWRGWFAGLLEDK